MNKKIIILSAALAMAFTTSCSSFLDEEPNDRLVTSNFYTNESDAQAAVDAIYNELYNIYQRQIFLMADLPTDTHKNGLGMPNTYLQNLEFLRHTTSNTFVRDTWKNNYEGIARANTAISHIEGADIADATKNRLEGEAKFLRALYYFNLVRFYGDVPLVLSAENVSDALGPRTPKADVYKQIEQDLTDAAQYLPAKVDASNSGRATSGAAKILLGKVYLTNGEYQQSADILRDVISNESTYGYSLGDYADNWDPQKEPNAESVFYIDFRPSPLTPNSEMTMIGPKYSASEYIGVASSYEADIPTRELYDSYEDGDTRKDVNLRTEFTNPVNGHIVKSSIPLFAKYWQDGIADPNQCEINIHIIRYADAILSYAEALNDLGQTDLALQQLNRVRERAFKGSSHDYSGLSQSQLKDAILKERFLEFPLEGQRWFDLVRNGVFVQRMKEHSAYEAAHAEANKVDIANNVKDYMVLMPIPQHEIDLNPELTQNPGWDGK